MYFIKSRAQHHQGSQWDSKTWRNGKAFSSGGIFMRLEKSGNFTQNADTVKKND